MSGYSLFLTIMAILFGVSAFFLLGLGLMQALRRRDQQARVYFGLTLVATVVSAGFYFFYRIL